MNSKVTREVNELWDELRTTIDKALASGVAELRDYASGGWHDDLGKLLDEETANERRHRQFSPRDFQPPITAPVAAKLILLGGVKSGCDTQEPLPATVFLTLRHSACIAMTIGQLLAPYLSAEFCIRVGALDYAAIMRAKK